MDNEQTNQIEIRRVQALTGNKSFTVVLPKAYSLELGIQAGDYLKVSIRGKQLILEKAKISNMEENES
jgi:antitoxin component of MazEF toxin-antitoxin module